MLKKNIMQKILFLLIFLLGSCTYQYTDEDTFNMEGVEKIYLNVKSFEINRDNFKNFQADSLLINEINNKLLKNLEAWAWKKFTIRGRQNIANLSLLKIDTNLIEKRKKKKLIVSIIEQNKEIYNISLVFDLSISDNKSLIKTLEISSNLNLVLLDKYSITQRDKVISYNISKLIKLIDEKVDIQLNKDTFKQFVIK